MIGMSAAMLQGVPGSTVDIDLWLDLSPRQYMRAINLACKIGAQFVRNTVVELADGSLINFVYAVTGLGSFAREFPHARLLPFAGEKIHVMPLKLIKKSKEAIRRPKDLVHLEYMAGLHQMKRARAKSSPGKKAAK